MGHTHEFGQSSVDTIILERALGIIKTVSEHKRIYHRSLLTSIILKVIPMRPD